MSRRPQPIRANGLKWGISPLPWRGPTFKPGDAIRPHNTTQFSPLSVLKTGPNQPSLALHPDPPLFSRLSRVPTLLSAPCSLLLRVAPTAALASVLPYSSPDSPLCSRLSLSRARPELLRCSSSFSSGVLLLPFLFYITYFLESFLLFFLDLLGSLSVFVDCGFIVF